MTVVAVVHVAVALADAVAAVRAGVLVVLVVVGGVADRLEFGWDVRGEGLAADVLQVVRGLVTSRRGGHWATTNETAWALDALVRYYRLAEADVPDLHVQGWLGSQLAFETAFQGRTAAVAEGRVPMHDLLAMQGDLGFTIGVATIRGELTSHYSKYLTVWKKQPDGEWRFVADGGNPVPTK